MAFFDDGDFVGIGISALILSYWLSTIGANFSSISKRMKQKRIDSEVSFAHLNNSTFYAVVLPWLLASTVLWILASNFHPSALLLLFFFVFTFHHIQRKSAKYERIDEMNESIEKGLVLFFFASFDLASFLRTWFVFSL